MDKSKSYQELELEKFIDPQFCDIGIETGYFAELNSSFKSSGDEIKKNYVKKMQEILKGREKLSFKHDKFVLKDLKRLVNSFKVVDVEEDRTEYLNMLRLRALASQYNHVGPLLKDGYFFPFMIFAVRDGDEQRLIELDFVEDILLD